MKCMRQVVNGTFGVSVKDKWVRGGQIDDRAMNPARLNNKSVVNIVDIKSERELATGRKKQCRRNGYTMQFDPICRICNSQLRCTSVPIGTIEERYGEYLSDFVLNPVPAPEKDDGDANETNEENGDVISSGSNEENGDVTYLNMQCYGEEEWPGGEDQLWVVMGNVTVAGETTDLLVIKQKDGSKTNVISKSHVIANDLNT